MAVDCLRCDKNCICFNDEIDTHKLYSVQDLHRIGSGSPIVYNRKCFIGHGQPNNDTFALNNITENSLKLT